MATPLRHPINPLYLLPRAHIHAYLHFSILTTYLIGAPRCQAEHRIKSHVVICLPNDYEDLRYYFINRQD